MKQYLVLAALVSFSSAAYARGVEVCPTLPADSGLEWMHQEGPDFDLCYANPVGSEDSAFGIYLGNHPSFKAKDGQRIEGGKVAGKSVDWYQLDGRDASDGRQTIVVIDKKTGYVAHIWLSADETLQDKLSVLEQIKFR